MDSINKGLSYTFAHSDDPPKVDFEAQVLASLMIQSNALISIKTAVQLCSISRQEIDRRIHAGTFPKPIKLSSDERSIRKAFRVQDILDWLTDPRSFCSSQNSDNSSGPKAPQ